MIKFAPAVLAILVAGAAMPAVARDSSASRKMSAECAAIGFKMAEAVKAGAAEADGIPTGDMGMSIAAMAAPKLIGALGGGMAAGLAAEILYAQNANRIADAEAAKLRAGDRASAKVDDLDAAFVAAGCDKE